MILTLVRETNEQADCTLGILTVEDLKLCTMELPWIPSETCKGGLKGKSCVPKGTYKLQLHDSPKHPKTWALVNHDLDVVHYHGDDNDPDEDRTTCLIHVGNFSRQSQGCILVGLSTTRVNGEYMVTSSVRAMERLRSVLPWTEGHHLEIIEKPRVVVGREHV